MFDFEEELKKFDEQIMQFELPRVHTLPDIDLYMEQVVSVIKRYLEPVKCGDESIITPAMINSYVKNNVIPAPVNKKYSAVHICYLVTVCLLKNVFSISQIKIFLTLTQDTTIAQKIDRYNLLCDEIETALKMLFCEHSSKRPTNKEPVPDSLVAFAIAGKIYCEKIVHLKQQKVGQETQISFNDLLKKVK